jgi:hypothetical protein
MKFPHRILKNDANGLIELVLGHDKLQELPRVLLVVLIWSDGALHNPNADHIVAVVHHVGQKPHERILGISVLVDADHEGARPPCGMVALVPGLQCERRGVVLGGLPNGHIIKPDVMLEPGSRKWVCCQRGHDAMVFRK